MVAHNYDCCSHTPATLFVKSFSKCPSGPTHHTATLLSPSCLLLALPVTIKIGILSSRYIEWNDLLKELTITSQCYLEPWILLAIVKFILKLTRYLNFQCSSGNSKHLQCARYYAEESWDPWDIELSDGLMGKGLPKPRAEIVALWWNVRIIWFDLLT